MDRKGMRIGHNGGTYYSTRNLIDHKLDTYSYVREGTSLYFIMPKVKLIKSIVLKTVKNTELKSVGIYAGMTQGIDLQQGSVTFNGTGDLVITFKKAVPLIRLGLKDFVNREDATSHWMGFSEVNFYEE